MHLEDSRIWGALSFDGETRACSEAFFTNPSLLLEKLYIDCGSCLRAPIHHQSVWELYVTCYLHHSCEQKHVQHCKKSSNQFIPTPSKGALNKSKGDVFFCLAPLPSNHLASKLAGFRCLSRYSSAKRRSTSWLISLKAPAAWRAKGVFQTDLQWFSLQQQGITWNSWNRWQTSYAYISPSYIAQKFAWIYFGCKGWVAWSWCGI